MCAAIAGGLFLIGLCFVPFACVSIPVAFGGIVSALFSKNRKIKTIGLIANVVVLVIAILLALITMIRLALVFERFDRF